MVALRSPRECRTTSRKRTIFNTFAALHGKSRYILWSAAAADFSVFPLSGADRPRKTRRFAWGHPLRDGTSRERPASRDRATRAAAAEPQTHLSHYLPFPWASRNCALSASPDKYELGVFSFSHRRVLFSARIISPDRAIDACFTPPRYIFRGGWCQRNCLCVGFGCSRPARLSSRAADAARARRPR